MNIQNEEQELLERIKTDPSFLENANIGLLSNKDFMMNTIKNNPKAIQYAPESFYADKKALFEVLKNDPSAIQFAPPEMQQKYAEQGISAFNPSPINVVENKIKDLLKIFRKDDNENQYNPPKPPSPFN